MMPSIQYARTEDGVSIAYFAIGQGSPLVIDVGQWSHVQREWDIPERQAWLERQAEKHTVIRFDHRGCGLSDRHIEDYSFEAFDRDIHAVLDRSGFGTAALFGTGSGQRNAISYAASHPERVSQLVIYHPFMLDGSIPTSFEPLFAIRDIDWNFYVDALVLWIQGWASGDASARISSVFRQAITPEAARAIQAAQRTDLQPLLSKLTMPTLLLYRPGVRDYDPELPRRIGSQLPNARSAFLDGETYAWYIPDSEKLVSTIDAFLEEHEYKPEPSPAAPENITVQELVTDTHVVLFTDIEGSSALASRYGDDHAHLIRRSHDRIVREALSQFRGKEVKHTGDGIMAAFGMASHGLDCAIYIQRGITAYNEEHPEHPLSIYVGLNAGEPIAEDDDLFGTSVDLAARICDYADPGQILISDVVRQLVAGKHYMFADLGHSDIRGMEEPIRLWEVRWQEEEATS